MGNLNEKNVLHLGAYPIWIFSDRVAHAHHFHQNSVVVVAYLELMNIQNSYNLRIPMNCSNLKNNIKYKINNCFMHISFAKPQYKNRTEMLTRKVDLSFFLNEWKSQN